jgi:hypothetical protein
MPVAPGDPHSDDPPSNDLSADGDLPSNDAPVGRRPGTGLPAGEPTGDDLLVDGVGEEIPPGCRLVDGDSDDPGDPGCGAGLAGDVAAAFGFGTGEQADELAPGPTLAVLTDKVVDGGVRGLDDDQLVGVLAAARRISSWATAVEADTAGELCRRREATGSFADLKYLADELAAALTTSVRAGEALAGFCAGLLALPATLAALRAGRIDRARAGVIVDELACLDPARAAAVEQLIIGAAANQTAGQLRHRVRRAVLAADPAAAERRRRERQRQARVELYDEQSGTAALSGRDLPTAAALAADAGVDASARALKAAGSPATLSQLRAAVFLARLSGQHVTVMLEAILGTQDPTTPNDQASPATADPDPTTADPAAAGSGDPPSAGAAAGPAEGVAMRGLVHLTVPLTTWLGLSQAPGEVAGFGPASGPVCRDIAGLIANGGRSRWCITLTNAQGQAIAHGCARCPPPDGPDRARWLAAVRVSPIQAGTCTHAREVTGYRIPDSLHHIVKTRQRTCSFPGCRRVARRCDDDHTIPHDQGGRTCECNLAPLCRRHHQAKQGQGWRLDQPAPGVLVWQLPHGRRYTVTPGLYPIATE